MMNGMPPSPPLSALDSSVDPLPPPPPHAAPAVAWAPHSYAAAAPSAPSAMAAFAQHAAASDALAAVTASAQSNAEGLLQLQSTLHAFKGKMRAAFDANMLTLDKKVRLVRRDVLSHISATVAELEKRMLTHLSRHSATGGSGDDAAHRVEFERGVGEELLYLKAELQKASFSAAERHAEYGRQRRQRDHAISNLAQRADESSSALQTMQAAVYSTEKENALLRSEVDALKSKLRRELSHASSEGASRVAELAKTLTDVKRSVEDLLRREEAAEADRADHAQSQLAQVRAEAQSYLDGQMNASRTAVRAVKRAQLTQQDQLDRMRRDMDAMLRVLKRAGVGAAAAEGDPDATALLGVDDDSTMLGGQRALASLSARVEALERESRANNIASLERASQLDQIKNTLSQTDSENKALLASSTRSLREEISRLERDASLRDTLARNWREEVNNSSRALEQTVLNLKYNVSNVLMLGGSSSPSASIGPGSSIGPASPSRPNVASDVSAFLEHPAATPLSQALSALEARSAAKIEAIERELAALQQRTEQREAQRSDLASPSSGKSSQQHEHASPCDAAMQAQEEVHEVREHVAQLEEGHNSLHAALQALDEHVAQQAAEWAQRDAEREEARKQWERETQQAIERAAQAKTTSATAPVTPALLSALDERLGSRLEALNSDLSRMRTELTSLSGSVGDSGSRNASLDQRVREVEAEVEALRSEVARQSALQAYQHQLHLAAIGSPPPSAAQTAPSAASSAASPPASSPSASPSSKPVLPRVLAAPLPAPGSTTKAAAHVERVPDSPLTLSASAPGRTFSSSGKAATSAPLVARDEPQAYDLDASPPATPVSAQESDARRVVRAPLAPLQQEDDEEDEDEAAIQLTPRSAARAKAAETPAVQGDKESDAKPSPPSTPADAPSQADSASSSSKRPATPATPSSKRPIVVPNFTPRTLPPPQPKPAPPSAKSLEAQVAARLAASGGSGSPSAASSPSASVNEAQTPKTGSSQSGGASSTTSSSSAKKAHTWIVDFNADDDMLAPPPESHSPTAPAQPAKVSASSTSTAPPSSKLPAQSATATRAFAHPTSAPSAPSQGATSGSMVGDDESSSEEEEDEVESSAEDAVLARGVPLPVPAISPASLPPAAAAAPVASSHDDDEDHTGERSRAVKQRYLDAERAGQVDGEVELDEDSLYDPDGPEDVTPPTRALSERAARIAQAISRNAAAQAGDEDQEDDDEDAQLDQSESADPADDGDLSLNSHFARTQAARAQRIATQYGAAHHALQRGDHAYEIEDDDEDDESESSSESRDSFPRSAPGAAMLAPGFRSSGGGGSAAAGHTVLSASLSPLGKPKSSLGVTRPQGSVSGLYGTAKHPSVSPASSSAASQGSPPTPVMATRSVAGRLAAGARSTAPLRHFDDDFDLDESSDEPMSSLSVDLRRLPQPSAAAGGGGGGYGSDDDFSTPRADVVREEQAQLLASRRTPLANPRAPQRSPLQGAAAGGRQPQQQHQHDADEFGDSLFDPADDDPQASAASYVSELDQMDLSASNAVDFDTSF